MKIDRLKVTGQIGFDYKFGKTNILLGTNESGKTTFINLILYGLGVHVSSFIREISEFAFCDYVYLEITTKRNNRYQIVRKLPNVDSVTIIPFGENDELQNEEIQILNLKEYSDFLLEEEDYEKAYITYSATRSATLTYRFLIRTALVDQFTSPTKILASLQGDKNGFMNNQELLNTAIIEQILDTLNLDLQKLRLEYKQTEKERSIVNAKISFYKDMYDEFEIEGIGQYKKVEKVNDELQKIHEEKKKLNDFEYEHVQKIEQINDAEMLDTISKLRQTKNFLKSEIAQIRFEIEDLNNLLPSFSDEVENLKKQIASQKVLVNIPVTICPVCFSEISDIEECGFCSHCKETRPQEILDSIASYKKTLEDTIKEIKILIDENKHKEKIKRAELASVSDELSKVESDYVNKLEKAKEPINNAISEIKERIQILVKNEYHLNELKRIMIQQNLLKSKKDELTRKLNDIRSDVEDAEKKSGRDAMVFIKFENVYKELFEKIYGLEHDVRIHKENYMPIIDGATLSQNSSHSASIKVVARLAYILALYLLNSYLEENKINNMQFVIFDSPRDKDLDKDKYKRFLEIIQKQNSGQIFLTGSYKDEDIFEEFFSKEEGVYIDFLTDNAKLLKKSCMNSI